ncbi:MAG TPA: DNA polymerase III subunit delta [Pyrinomonadaceae bacterium]|nr:DNA polymerase III subunit delta [Pyrinomonadaceae bacterium]
MPHLTREQLREQLIKHVISPVYVLYGAETYLRDIAARTITERSFGDGDFRDFNDAEFSLAESDSIQNALAAAEQLPMMSKKRVVRITDVRVAATSNRDTLREENESALLRYLKRPAEGTVLIFVADELNSNRRISKILLKDTVTVEFGPLTDADLAKWARGKVRDAGSEIDERTLQLLISLVGPDVRRLTNEVQKLSAAALPDRIIARELVETLVIHSREISNFGLTDHLLGGRKAKALETLKKILDDGGEPLALLGLIGSNYRRLLAAKSLMDRGADRSAVTGAVRMPPFQLDGFLTAARRADTNKLAKAITRIADTDLAIKTSIGGSGPQGARIQIEMLVCELSLM